jgi:UDP-2,3-diacylglucosamine pyrophosphatase LpxH
MEPVHIRGKRMQFKDIKKVSITSDLHGQCKSEEAFDVHLQIVKDFKPDVHIIIGDWMEFESVSRHPKSKTRIPNLGYEYQVGNRDLDTLEAVLPSGCKKFFMEGNHEYRLWRWMCNEAPNAKGGMKSVSEALRLKERKWNWIPYGRALKIGQLKIMHGCYNNKYHAQTHVDRFGDNVLYGDSHSYQVYTTAHGDKPHMAMSIGCLRTLNPDWLNGKPAPWLHGFALVYFTQTGEFISYFVPIIKGMSIWNNKVYYDRQRNSRTRKGNQERFELFDSGSGT